MQATGSDSPQNTYRLSIHLLVDGLSVYVYNSSGTVVRHACRNFSDANTPARVATVRAFLSELDSAKERYEQVELVAHSPATYVPVELFRRSDMMSLYRLTFSSLKLNNADIRHRILPSLDVVEIFSINHALVTAVSEFYPQIQVLGRCGQVVCQAVECVRTLTDDEPRMYVQQDATELHVCVVQGTQLRFACAYPALTDEDRLYYLLAVWRNMELDAQKTLCLLSNISEHFCQEVKNYILNVDTCA